MSFLDYTNRLQHQMRSVGLTSFKALSERSGVSEKLLRHLRRGQVGQLRGDALLKISQALQVSVADLLVTYSDGEVSESSMTSQAQPSAVDLQQEYDRLQQQLQQQKEILKQEFQQEVLQKLESLLLQLPTAAYAAQNNPQAPAVKLLPLLRPIDQLLASWGITAIAAVGQEVPYDPSQHQLIEGMAQPGDVVWVRYTGYRQGEKLLYRAKVSAKYYQPVP